MKKWLLVVGACIQAAALMGCAGAVIQGAKGGLNSKVRDDNLEAANAGDANAQYLVGKSYCCSVEGVDNGFYNTQTATQYLCMAARQGHGEAAFMLGEIHSGKRSHGGGVLRKVAYAVVSGNQVNAQLAYYWYNFAKESENSDAIKRLEKLPIQNVSGYSTPAETACTIEEAYPEE